MAATRASIICLAQTKNNFVPEPPNEHVDLVYLCFPNNPTGAVASRAQLSRWVDYALQHGALLLFDAAYEAYIFDPEIPHSIFEIPGARQCAIELRSFSKNGGFTGVRCGFTVMPKSVLARTADGRRLPLHPLWQRRWSTKSNSVAYPVQRAAEALYSAEGRKQVRALIDHYMTNAKLLRAAAVDASLEVFGGINAPYIWVKTPTASQAGRCSTQCCARLTWLLRRALVSGRKAKAIFVFLHSTAAITLRKWRGV